MGWTFMENSEKSFGGTIMGTDYAEGAHPDVLAALTRTNAESTPGYGSDIYCEKAQELIRSLCEAPGAAVYFFTGGTQVNAVTLGALLSSWQGVLAAGTAHISLHEAGAVENGGHKVIELPSYAGKLSPEEVRTYCSRYYGDETWEHIVMPGGIYLSQPTEYGTLYTLEELRTFRAVCDEFGLFLYVDGARLACALAAPENDVCLRDLAGLSDAFYIGGNKCGALFGEALVVPDPKRLPHFFSVMKQHGAVLAKGRLLGVQFLTLLQDGLYERIGKHAVGMADALRQGLDRIGAYQPIQSPTNQVFVKVSPGQYKALQARGLGGFWSHEEDESFIVRFVSSWATSLSDVETVLSVLSVKEDE